MCAIRRQNKARTSGIMEAFEGALHGYIDIQILPLRGIFSPFSHPFIFPLLGS